MASPSTPPSETGAASGGLATAPPHAAVEPNATAIVAARRSGSTPLRTLRPSTRGAYHDAHWIGSRARLAVALVTSASCCDTTCRKPNDRAPIARGGALTPARRPSYLSGMRVELRYLRLALLLLVAWAPVACSSSGSGGSGTGGAAGLGGGGTSSGGSGAGGSGGSSATGGSSGTDIGCDPLTSTTCYCSKVDPGAAGNDTKCSPTENASGGFCCASPGWPDQGDCLCGPMLCNTIGSSCTCAVGLWKSGDPSCTGAYCCLDTIDQCKCGPDPCGVDDTPVSTCDDTVFGCGKSSTKVAACR